MERMTDSGDNSAIDKQLFPAEINVGVATAQRRQTAVGEVNSLVPKALLEAAGASQLYHPNVELFRQDALAKDIFLVETGLIKVSRIEKNGREVIVDLRHPGFLLGVSSAILDQPHAVSALTLTDCHVRRIPASIFHQLLQSDLLVSQYVHRMHSREMLDKISHIAQLSCLTARERLILLLRRLVSVSVENESSLGVKIHLPLKHWELAQLVAVTPEHLSRLLKRMEQKGILRQEKNWLFLTFPE